MRIRRVVAAASALAITAVAAALTTGLTAVPAAASSAAGGPYAKYLTISGPTTLEVGGAWGVWAVHAKNPGATADTTDHLVFNAGGSIRDRAQWRFQVRTSATGTWRNAPIKWYRTTRAQDPAEYLAAFDVTGAALKLAPHADRTFQFRVTQVPTRTPVPSWGYSLSVFLTPKQAANGQGGNWLARADAGVTPSGLHTAIIGLPARIPADGRTRRFTVHIATTHKADWRLADAAFFLWQGQKYGSMGGPAACDAEVDVQDARTHLWHRVSLNAGGTKGGLVKIAWGSGPAYNRYLSARITLGRNFHATGSDAQLAFGQFDGSGDTNAFWTAHKFTSTSVKAAPACA